MAGKIYHFLTMVQNDSYSVEPMLESFNFDLHLDSQQVGWYFSSILASSSEPQWPQLPEGKWPTLYSVLVAQLWCSLVRWKSIFHLRDFQLMMVLSGCKPMVSWGASVHWFRYITSEFYFKMIKRSCKLFVIKGEVLAIMVPFQFLLHP
jgi:hypothetical protein